MKKKIVERYLTFMLIVFLTFINNVFAYGYDVTVTSDIVTVGNSATLNIKGNGITGKFNITSSNSEIVSLSENKVWIENNTQSITINTKKVGTVSLTITPIDIATNGVDPKQAVLSTKTISITVKDKPKPNTNNSGTSGYKPQKKSSNNFLSSLTIDNIELNEKFDKELLEYSITVPANTEKIKINAQLEDSNSKITGIGEVEVSAGLNTFEIVVSAENGSKRTYILKVTVEELKPIKVNIDNEEYIVIRKRKELPKISEYFIEKDIVIDDNIVEGYYNEELDYTIVGLKNSVGKINFYIYKDNKYTKYMEYSFNGIVLQILDKTVPNTKKTSFLYDGDNITSYQEVKLDYLKNTYALNNENNQISGNQFYLFYAVNVSTGKESLYQYDASEKTIQKYNTLILDLYKERSDKYYLLLLSSILFLGIVITIFTIILLKKNNGTKYLKKKTSNLENEKIIESEEKFSFDDLPIKKNKKTNNKIKD